MDEIAAEYTQAVAQGEFERAAGWFAVARFVSAREGDAVGSERPEALQPAQARRAGADGVGD